MDIERYLNRINYQGAREPTLQVLQQLQLAHLMTVPFENLDIHYQRKIVLEPERLFTKVMHNNRGGFCYELNGLFSELLRAFGFEVTQISARVWSDSKKAWPPEFDHMALLVHIDGSIYMTDVGFGDSFFVPLRLTPDLIQRDRKGLYRIRQFDSTYQLLEYFSEEKWTNCYIFTEVPRQLEDFAERC
ncbi:MAG: arylamine N-acetyltransferase, partial [Bacteroidota bacterium]